MYVTHSLPNEEVVSALTVFFRLGDMIKKDKAKCPKLLKTSMSFTTKILFHKCVGVNCTLHSMRMREDFFFKSFPFYKGKDLKKKYSEFSA